MNVLCINNYHYLKGGAERVFFEEMNLLKSKGCSISVFSRDHNQNVLSEYDKFFPSKIVTDQISYTLKELLLIPKLFYSMESKCSIQSLLNKIKVDVAHAHNIYGRLTTSILDTLRKNRIPIIMTLHDYKVLCPNYKMMHHGKICQDCYKHSYYNAILNCCHKNSFVASAIYAFETYFNFIFKKYHNNVQYFISPSKFLKTKLIDFGWPKTRIKYIPNFISSKNFTPNFVPGKYFLYIGRLSSEKGINTLIKAFSTIKEKDIELKIAGDGPLEKKLRDFALKDKRIKFCGFLSGIELAIITKKALAVVVPSEWFENAPLSVLEAMAYGKPVIGSKIGGIPEIIEHNKNGYLFESGSADALAKVMITLMNKNHYDIEKMGREARERIENTYNEESHFNQLMKVYYEAKEIMR